MPPEGTGDAVDLPEEPRVDESTLLRDIFRAWAGRSSPKHVETGPGDDACVLRLNSGGVLLVTVDHAIAGRHFRPDTPMELVGRKAVARSASDLAAMGVGLEWGATLATAAFPPGFPQALAEGLAHGLRAAAEEFGLPLVGGDIASYASEGTPLTLTVTALGFSRERPVLRSGASVGDEVWVTGCLGGAWAGERHLRFMPRLPEAAALRALLGDRLHAMMDVSDGLGLDLGRLASASGLRIEVESGLLPVSEGCDWRAAVGDGEDYELAFVAAPGSALPAVLPGGVPLTRIGRAVSGEGCHVRTSAGVWEDVTERGWVHG